jgi:homogentisate 1,2-dioxygenase
LEYQNGFGNHLSTEALAGALPVGQNSPQKAPLGLYPEQLSGSAFTAARSENLRSWLYRIRPSVMHGAFRPADAGKWQSETGSLPPTPPDQLRWDPIPIPNQPIAWPQGVTTYAINGDVSARAGCAAHVYALTKSMENDFFYDADGELLFVPEQGAITLRTELGALEVAPGEIAVVPRGVKFQVTLKGPSARGYLAENFGQPLRLPGLGPIGANGLANPRDFLAPVAAYEDKTGSFTLTARFEGRLWSAALGHSPLDVVGWHGNYFPYKYDLARFNTVNTVSFDHPDPSIFTVLTSPSELPGTANLDFVIFPPRWMVAEHTFRPPYFHRNVMSEFMGLIKGKYDAKAEGFVPGGASLHNCLSGHGPDGDTFEAASNAELKPQYLGDTLAFMFETRFVWRPTAFALETPQRQKGYQDCWQTLKKHFKK